MSQEPFFGVFRGLDGELYDLATRKPVNPTDISNHKLPFNGVFYDKDHKKHDLLELGGDRDVITTEIVNFLGVADVPVTNRSPGIIEDIIVESEVITGRLAPILLLLKDEENEFTIDTEILDVIFRNGVKSILINAIDLGGLVFGCDAIEYSEDVGVIRSITLTNVSFPDDNGMTVFSSKISIVDNLDGTSTCIKYFTESKTQSQWQNAPSLIEFDTMALFSSKQNTSRVVILELLSKVTEAYIKLLINLKPTNENTWSVEVMESYKASELTNDNVSLVLASMWLENEETQLYDIPGLCLFKEGGFTHQGLLWRVSNPEDLNILNHTIDEKSQDILNMLDVKDTNVIPKDGTASIVFYEEDGTTVDFILPINYKYIDNDPGLDLIKIQESADTIYECPIFMYLILNAFQEGADPNFIGISNLEAKLEKIMNLRESVIIADGKLDFISISAVRYIKADDGSFYNYHFNIDFSNASNFFDITIRGSGNDEIEYNFHSNVIGGQIDDESVAVYPDPDFNYSDNQKSLNSEFQSRIQSIDTVLNFLGEKQNNELAKQGIAYIKKYDETGEILEKSSKISYKFVGTDPGEDYIRETIVKEDDTVNVFEYPFFLKLLLLIVENNENATLNLDGFIDLEEKIESASNVREYISIDEDNQLLDVRSYPILNNHYISRENPILYNEFKFVLLKHIDICIITVSIYNNTNLASLHINKTTKQLAKIPFSIPNGAVWEEIIEGQYLGFYRYFGVNYGAKTTDTLIKDLSFYTASSLDVMETEFSKIAFVIPDPNAGGYFFYAKEALSATYTYWFNLTLWD